MTSITTILALLPFLFDNSMGNVLQRPLALTIIGGMTAGTFISLYLIPVLYQMMEKDNRRNPEGGYIVQNKGGVNSPI